MKRNVIETVLGGLVHDGLHDFLGLGDQGAGEVLTLHLGACPVFTNQFHRSRRIDHCQQLKLRTQLSCETNRIAQVRLLRFAQLHGGENASNHPIRHGLQV